MKVLFVGNDESIITGDNADTSGRMKTYARHFDKLSIVIFSLKKDKLTAVQNGNLEVYPTNSASRWYFIFDALKIIQKLDYDLVSTQDPFIAGLVGVLAKFLWQKKLNIQIHNDFFDSPYFRKENLQNYIFFWLGKLNILFADSIRVVSPRLKKWANAFVAPVAANLDFFWSKPHTRKFNQIVCVARLVKQKNLPLLFEAARAFPDQKFVIVGEGEERKNLEKSKPQNVILVGQKKQQEVKEILARSDIFVLTSNYEGWGVVAIEALAAGLPVVMTDTGCAGEVIIDKKTGLVAPVGNKNKLIEKINWAINHLNESKKQVLAGQKLLEEKYRQDKLVSQLITGLRKTR